VVRVRQRGSSHCQRWRPGSPSSPRRSLDTAETHSRCSSSRRGLSGQCTPLKDRHEGLLARRCHRAEAGAPTLIPAEGLRVPTRRRKPPRPTMLNWLPHAPADERPRPLRMEGRIGRTPARISCPSGAAVPVPIRHCGLLVAGAVPLGLYRGRCWPVPWTAPSGTTCRTTPIRSRNSCSPAVGSNPSTETRPASRSRWPSRISQSVVLPAPLGPGSPNTSPLAISRSTHRHRGRWTVVVPFRTSVQDVAEVRQDVGMGSDLHALFEEVVL
jgi:hypothetical protein